MNEFQMIKDYFAKQITRPDVTLGIGDDAALIMPPANQLLTVTTDTLIAGVHFPIDTDPHDIGYKALAVNLSDLAAMGAEAAWVTMALTLPHPDQHWLEHFCSGFFQLAAANNVQLIGGDVTKGHLSITVTALGFVPNETAICRSNAKIGDLIYVTGTLGDAGLALQIKQYITPVLTDNTAINRKLNRPEPRLNIGHYLRGKATAAIDISDGLAADLGHILEQSKVGARVIVDDLPSSATLKKLPTTDAIHLALTAGDDYELCFTINPSERANLENHWHFHDAQGNAIALTCIGEITASNQLMLYHRNGDPYQGQIHGYQHF